MPQEKNYDIAVVGAGLVGASFVALLAQQLSSNTKCLEKPLTIALIDGGQEPARPDLETKPPVFDPRVVALTHSSQALFEQLGVWQTIQNQRACAYTHMHVWDDEGTASIDFSARDIGQKHLGTIVENSIVLGAVLDYLASLSSKLSSLKLPAPTLPVHVDIYRGISVTAITENQHAASIECNDGTQFSCDLLIAADGGQSKVRELMAMETRQWDYQHKAIVATVESEHSHQFTAWQNFLSTGPLALLPLQHNSERYCSIVWSLETEKADAMMALDEKDFCQQLAYAFEQRLGNVISVSRRFCFPLIQRHAVNYHHNNIVLMGDAAHTIHPLAGQGVNLGLLDAAALVNELTRALGRGLPVNHESLMRRYQRQRKTHNLETMAMMEGFKRLFGSRQLWVRWLRNTGLKAVNDCAPLKNWLAKKAIRQ